ncbi:MAG: GNAT family N-acetyltransferase [Saprospiraceae bacterium]|nr:GNAT family N-acetyltransferase [Saprospiraceae bacterium]
MIRPYNPSDHDALLDVLKRNVPANFAPEEVGDFEQYLVLHGDHYQVFEHDGKVVGGSGYNVLPETKEGRISWIFFDPEYAGKGLGKQLTYHVLGILKDEPEVDKLVVRTSQMASPFFEKFGFKLTDVQKDYWAEGIDLYYMEMGNE